MTQPTSEALSAQEIDDKLLRDRAEYLSGFPLPPLMSVDPVKDILNLFSRLDQALARCELAERRVEELTHHQSEEKRLREWIFHWGLEGEVGSDQRDQASRALYSDDAPPPIEDFTHPDDGKSESCATCGRGYLLWHAPQPLWDELIGHYHGTRCPRCFMELAHAAGIRLTWMPVVTRRDGVATTNWWSDPIRDRLLVGEPDPHFHDNEKAQVPQGYWGAIAEHLGWDYESPYPDENRTDTMEGVVYKDSGVNAEAAAQPEPDTGGVE